VLLLSYDLTTAVFS